MSLRPLTLPQRLQQKAAKIWVSALHERSTSIIQRARDKLHELPEWAAEFADSEARDAFVGTLDMYLIRESHEVRNDVSADGAHALCGKIVALACAGGGDVEGEDEGAYGIKRAATSSGVEWYTVSRPEVEDRKSSEKVELGESGGKDEGELIAVRGSETGEGSRKGRGGKQAFYAVFIDL